MILLYYFKHKYKNIDLIKVKFMSFNRIFVIVFCFLIPILSYSKSDLGIILDNNLRIREKPNLNSKVIGYLNKGDKVKVIKKASKSLIIKRFYGQWLEIIYKKKKGYVFSSFVNFNNDKSEKFHLFYDKFYKSMKEEGKFYLNRVKYPIIIETVGLEEYSEKEKIKNSKEMKSVSWVGDGTEMPATFTLKNNKIIAFIDYEGTGCAYSWFFKLIRGKWYLRVRF